MAARCVAQRAAQRSRPPRDIVREPRTRFSPKPFCTREVVHPGIALGQHRVWVDNLPYDVTLSDVLHCFGKTCTVTGTTLYRPPLSAAMLLRRRNAEFEALDKQMLEDKCSTARTASNAARALKQWQERSSARGQTGKRGRPRARAVHKSEDDDGQKAAFGSAATGRETGEVLEIMRHGDFNALRCFGFVHVAEDTDRLKALSRSLRIFGLAFRGRQCPTIDESLKRILYIGGLPPSHGKPEAVLHFLTARAGHLLTSAVDVVHAYEHDEGTTSQGQAVAVQRATVARRFQGGDDAALCGQFLVQVKCPQAARELLRRLVQGDCDSYICKPMLSGHPVVARWADSFEERYLYATRRTEYELLNDED